LEGCKLENFWYKKYRNGIYRKGGGSECTSETVTIAIGTKGTGEYTFLLFGTRESKIIFDEVIWKVIQISK